jgi:Zn-dependent protease
LAAVSLLAAFDAMFLPGASLLVALAGVGLIVVVVNLVPAPFMDGGRTILALTTGHAGPRLRAVQTALWAVTVAIILTATATIAARF